MTIITETFIAVSNDLHDRIALGIIYERDAEIKNFDIKAVFQAIVADYSNSIEAMNDAQLKTGVFNYGDMIQNIPYKFYKAHGIRIVDTFATELIDDHDKNLLE